MTSQALPSARPPSKVGRVLAVVGSVLLFAPLAGLSVTVITIIREFAKAGAGMPASDPASISGPIGSALIATAVGYGISLLGAILVAIAVWGCRYSPPWLWSTLMAACVLWLLAAPVGTLVAVIVIVFLIRSRDTFKEPKVT